MKRTITAILALLFVSHFAVAGGEQEAPQSDGELSGSIVWTDAEAGQDEQYEQLAEEFMERHPGVDVRHEFIDPDQALQTRIAAGEMPDIWQNFNNQVSPKDYADLAVPLDDLGYGPDDFVGYEYGVGTDGKLYFLGLQSSYIGMHYNKKAFERAGIDSFPRTIEEFYAACEKLKNAGITPVGTAYNTGWPMMPYFSMVSHDAVLQTTGNPAYYQDLADSDVLLQDDGYLHVLNVLRELNERGYLEEDLFSASWDDLERNFANGDVAMYFHGSWFTRVISERFDVPYEDLGMAPFPGAEAITASGGGGFGIWHDSDNIEAAKAFLRFMYEDGRYSKAGITEPAQIGAEPNNPLVEELLSYDLPLVSVEPGGLAFVERQNDAEIDTIAFIQEYLITDDPEALVEEVNEKWAQAE
jgi:raffinose/stachyose/melibiose transport system substrate-binding protein